MKKSFILFLFILSGALFACKGKPENNLTKAWKVTDISTSVNLQDDVKQAMLANSQLVFTKDGKYTSSGGIGADQGTYTLSDDGKTLTTVSQAGAANATYSIERLSDNKLVISNNGNTFTCEPLSK